MKALLYLGSIAAALLPPANAPKFDHAQLALCESIGAYTRAVNAVAELRPDSSQQIIREAQRNLRAAYDDLEHRANRSSSERPRAIRVSGPGLREAPPDAAQRLTALLDVSPASSARRPQAKLACVPAGTEGARLPSRPPGVPLHYALHCGPRGEVGEVDARNPLWLLSPVPLPVDDLTG
jgi:hypothetical protein